MEWTRQVDAYCERLDPSFWSEPVNAVTNGAFLIAAVILWQRSAGLPLCRVLAAVLFSIGIGSWLFHTHATVWAGVADVLPILLFVLIYTYAANRYYWSLPAWVSVAGAALVVPWLAALTPLFGLIPGFSVSAMYWPIPLLIGIYALLLRNRLPRVAGGLAIGVAILCVSLTARSLDEPLCDAIPLGTHWLWHILNGIMLGWMIEVLRRHRLDAGGALR